MDVFGRYEYTIFFIPFIFMNFSCISACRPIYSVDIVLRKSWRHPNGSPNKAASPHFSTHSLLSPYTLLNPLLYTFLVNRIELPATTAMR